MSESYIKITKGSLEDYLKENPYTSKNFILKKIFFWDIFPKNESYKAFDYFLTEVPPEAEAVINYEQVTLREIPDYIQLEEGDDPKNLVYVEVTGQALISFENLSRKKLFH